MSRIFNFSAGPSMLPESVLEKAASEMLNYKDSGMSVMEMSHRSKVYDKIIKETEQKLRDVMSIPDNYKVLFLQGGATLQFSMIPMNLMVKNGKADYIVSGSFSGNAYKEAQKYGEVNLAGTSKEDNFSHIPTQEELTLTEDADYLHICENNTIFGTTYNYLPETGGVPIVSDMSSCILSKPVDVSKYGMIYAGAQKNMGPAGLTVVIIREDLIGEPQDKTPVMLRYDIMAKNDSMYNTPPTYAIYILGLVLDWVESMGGVEGMLEHNEKKAAILYDYLDSSKLFKTNVVKENRSIMNVTFYTGNEELDAKFVKETAAKGFSNLKGHRSVGGMRASIYNAMPIEGVQALVDFMREFEKENA
ncbi:3-phosphoserine/phosphohydroxythreonine transaminase [Proteiniclasticum sp.]|uniref:3-phosphoserine/phosphohydroxythreonine transaminase n=1 Tax=Proteiniclasticum sp. TaxID=2053595 RepID=UPI0028A08EFF|nr:3-phosphoserine/phosphohydroxythreonine transaminase [Proteiniclasticum sp.]